MANSEHLKILKQGVKVWNEWRKQNPETISDLRKADLIDINLSGANLTEANLSKASLMKAHLNRANLVGANLTEVNLSGAILIEANLNSVDLTKAILHFTDLSNANLMIAKLVDANLSRANLSGAQLFFANLSGADLSEANLIDANLNRANLSGANLRKAILSGADLKGSEFLQVNLTDCNFNYADFRDTELYDIKFTGASFYNTALDSWQLKNIECDYIFIDKDRKVRHPKNRNFEPGEFEKLYQLKPTIEIEFPEGMSIFDPVVLDYIAQKINSCRPELGIKLISINRKGIFPTAKLEMNSESDKINVMEIIASESNSIKDEVNDLKSFIAIYMQDLKFSSYEFKEGQLEVVKGIKELQEGQQRIDSKIDTYLNTLAKEGITLKHLENLVDKIKDDQALINSIQNLQSKNIGNIKYDLELLNPHFKKAFNKTFDTKETKILKVLSKTLLGHFSSDILGDQTNF